MIIIPEEMAKTFKWPVDVDPRNDDPDLWNRTRIYWTCIAPNDIGYSFRMQADPVSAMTEAEAAAVGAFHKTLLQVVSDAEGHLAAIEHVWIGETCRDQLHWDDLRQWYPLYVVFGVYQCGGSFPEQQDRPFNISPLAQLGRDFRDTTSKIFNTAIGELGEGRFIFSLPGYEWRWQVTQDRMQPFKMPHWDGKFFDGMSLLVHAEQGAGDTIMFARYLSWLNGNGVIVDFLCPVELVELMQTTMFSQNGGNVITSTDEGMGEYDYHVGLCSLPLALDPLMEEIPHAPYLRSDRDKYFSWKDRIRRNGFNVGINWSGSTNHEKNAERCLTLEQVIAACPEDSQLFSFQMGEPAKQLKFLPENIKVKDLAPHIKTFADSAAAVDNMDLIVTIDSGLAHLAGAIGRPVKLLLPENPEWRWKMDLKSGVSRWYSSVRFSHAHPLPLRSVQESNCLESLSSVCSYLDCDGHLASA